MNLYTKIFSALLFLAITFIGADAMAKYTYIHNEGEYSIELPDAPSGQTIYAEDPYIPYLSRPPRYGAIGEYAHMKRTDPNTGDYLEVNITFLKSNKDYLLSLTKEAVVELLEKDYEKFQIDRKQINYSSTDNSPLKWATLTGFSTNRQNQLIYNTGHFLTGTDTILVVHIQYSVENQRFNKMYQEINKSIKYVGK